MKLSLVFAGLLAVAAASACASNEPAPPEPPGNTPPAAKTCDYGGTSRAMGETFPSTDGCNSCSCTEAGVACTKKACAEPAPTTTATPTPTPTPTSTSACSPEKEPTREYKIRNPDECKTALFRCATGKKPFFNACGCGCE